MVNPFNAFVDPNLKITSKHEGKLTGYQFAVKDVFAIRGIQASAGNPDWLKTPYLASFTNVFSNTCVPIIQSSLSVHSSGL